jgi:ABC-type oligopeptide transport system substrate-binding subunit
MKAADRARRRPAAADRNAEALLWRRGAGACTRQIDLFCALASALRSIGYRPRVFSGDAQFYQRLANPHGQWNISDGDWTADYPSPGEFLDFFLTCANYHPEDPARTTNGGGFCNARFDHLVRQAEVMQLTNPAAAQDIWARADRLAVDKAAWVPLVNTASAELLSRRAGHFTLDANSQPQIDQLWVR